MPFSNLFLQNGVQRVPALSRFWDLEKTVLHEIRVSGNFISHTWNSVKVCTELYPSSDRSI